VNILQLSTHLNIGGIGSYVTGISARLKKRGHNIVVVSSGGDMEKELVSRSIPHISLDIKTKSELSPKLFRNIPRLLSIVRSEKIDVIHAHTRITQVLACIVSRLAGIPYVVTCHGFFRKKLGRRIFKCWGDKTIAISDAVKTHLMNNFNVAADDIALVYNGVDIDRFNKRFTNDEKKALKKSLNIRERTVIGAIGRLSSVKGYEYLIYAFKLLIDELKDIRLLIVGDGSRREYLIDKAKRLKVDKYITFERGRLDTPEFLSIMDVFVSSAIQEGLGLSIVEALAAGRPVVASNVGGISSIVKDGRTGILTKAKDARALAGAIKGLLNNTALKDKFARRGRDLVEDAFTIDRMVDKIEGVYKASRSHPDKKKILIISVNWLGDVLFTTPFIKAIRKRFPASHIACMVMPRCKEMLEDNPNVDEIIIYDEDHIHKSLMGKFKLILSLRKKRFNTAFILHRSFTKALITFLSGIRVRIGYSTKKRGLLLTSAIEEPVEEMHKIEYFLRIASECGADTHDKDYEFFVNKDEKDAVDHFLKSEGVNRGDIIVVINPGGNWLPKRWPKEKFAKLSRKMIDELGARVVITGAKKDIPLSEEIESLSRAKVINACGKTSLKRLGAFMERADLVVSSDSGPMHLATSVKSKVIALFGPTSNAITGPYGTGHFEVIRKNIGCPVPCYNFGCRDHKCMDAITVDEVFTKAKEVLSAR